MSAAEKKQLRTEGLRRRGSFFSSGKAEPASLRIITKLKEDPAYQNAAVILCFVSFGTEVDTHAFIKEALQEGKRIFVPYIPSKKEGMKACEIKDFSELEMGYFNILTPKEEYRRLTEEVPDLVVVPGVVFSQDGYRIGYGGGFYDRYLGAQKKPIPTIGIGFAVQVVQDVPVEPFDMPIDKLITEEKTYLF